MVKLKSSITHAIQFVEGTFAVILVALVCVFAVASAMQLTALDWTDNSTFYELIYKVLLMVIGLELARLLVTHNLLAVIELISFVIARKTLKPDISGTDVALVVVSFALLIGARHVLLHGLRHDPSHSHTTQ